MQPNVGRKKITSLLFVDPRRPLSTTVNAPSLRPRPVDVDIGRKWPRWLP